MNPLLHFPAHLITGDHTQTESQVIQWLKEIVPHTHSDSECSVCNAIHEKNMYAFSWIAPENRYTLETIAPLFSRIALQLGPDQHHFFVITRAELLTQACANTLLKIVEEPPVGYHFIFTAPHKQLVLPTIVSRCVETSLSTSTKTHIPTHPLVAHACSFSSDWPAISKEISGYTLNEHETVRLFESIFTTFTTLYKKKSLGDDTISFSLVSLEKILHMCKDILDKPLQPGSAKIIWKDFFLYKTLCTENIT